MSVFITGASSGFGRELAKRYAVDGHVVGVLARRADELKTLCDEITASGGESRSYVGDVTDVDFVKQSILSFEEDCNGIDIMIANAGMADSVFARDYSTEKVAQIINVNLMGVVGAIAAVLPGMISRCRGQVVGISSLAGFITSPGSGPYGASKAAMTLLLDSLRPDAAQYGIFVTTICPGFVKTPMTDRNAFSMPFLMPLERGVDRIYMAIKKKKRFYVFPKRLYAIICLFRLLPRAWQDRLSTGRPYIKR
ncbi:SDR family NAD(P)-dependent oxidoreductase [bacterium]|jgi:short-subunit dehydrogenase|nr:SDR family NAD(P)-dependent oxidoreductase [bacterium]